MIEGPLDALRGDLDRLASVDPRMLTGAQIEQAERDAFAAIARLQEFSARLVPQAENLGLPIEAGTTSTTAWLSKKVGVSRGEAGRIVKAGHLVADVEATRAEWAAGRLSTEKAIIIAEAIDRLPEWANGDDERRDAEQTLLSFAAEFGVSDLKRLANTIVEVIDPEGADEHLGKKLAEQEKKAWDRTRAQISRLGNGVSKVTAVIPDAQADMLRTALEALAAPRRWHLRAADEGSFADLPHSQRMGVAFCELIEHLPTDKLPSAGGTSAVITVNLDHSQLISGLGAATLSSGTTISAGQARRLACNAGLIPLVLDGTSRILDHGTSKRLHDRYQRIAIAARDGGCCWQDCDRPPSWCEAHHLVEFDSGGPTSIDNGALFCWFHHRLLHSGDWYARLAPDGIVDVIPPARVDPQRRPRRHARHTQLQPVAV